MISGKLPRGVIALGIGSLFMDLSSELIHSLLPLYMASVLGASMTAIGMIEGVAEATAAITKIFSGAISDYFRKRKFLLVLGYGLSALTKPVFPLAENIIWVFGARFADRIGKGIRGAPRDALVADITPRELRGAAFGLRQSLDSVGAFLGPLLSLGLMILLTGDIRAVLWIAVVPAWLTVMILIAAVKEPEYSGQTPKTKPGLSLSGARRLGHGFWLVAALGAIFTLARFSEAFLILRAQDLGLSLSYAPAIMIVMNVVYAGAAYPAGLAADRSSPRTLLLAGLFVLILADAMLALAPSPSFALLGAGFWGMHMALTQGLLTKLVADAAPPDLRGTAFGIFNLVTGAALLLASLIAGILWHTFGAAATFFAGAFFAALAAMGLIVYRPRHEK